MVEYIDKQALLAEYDRVHVGPPGGARKLIEEAPAADVVPVVRCRDCKHRNKQKCPLVMVRFDMRPNGAIKKVLEQNYVDEEFWCKDGARMDGGDGNG